MRAQHRPCERQRGIELAELVVDGDPQSLEDALGGMPAREARGRRDRLRDDVDELDRRGDRLAGALAGDRAGDLAGVALFAEVAEDRLEVARLGLVDELVRAALEVGVHAHVQGRVVGVGEPARPRVDLHRRHAEVQQDDVRFDALVAQLLETRDERRADEARGGLHVGCEVGEALGGRGVAVDRDEGAARPDAIGQQAGVAARAERAVDDDLAGLRIEQLDRLAGEHRHVRNGHVKQCGQGVR